MNSTSLSFDAEIGAVVQVAGGVEGDAGGKPADGRDLRGLVVLRSCRDARWRSAAPKLVEFGPDT